MDTSLRYLERIESVWDYPRPPALVRVGARVTIEFGGAVIAESDDAYRVLETSHPPTIYLPPESFVAGALIPAPGGETLCEWKGRATYLDVVGGDGRRVAQAAWTYLTPSEPFRAITAFVSVYPGRMDRCLIDGEAVGAQEGDFYGGWVTSNLRGPLKGTPGTRGW